MTILKVEDLDCRYGLLQAVRGVSFEVAQGETVALIGANGAGKSTLLRAIAGAHIPHAGHVFFDGADVTPRPAHRRVSAGIALVPEGRRLFPSLTVEENLRVAAARRGRWTVDSVLEVFPLLRSRLHMPAATLSGGEQQAVAVGRALPRMILLGYILQLTVLERSLRAGILTPLLATFGLSIVIQNLLLITFSPDVRSLGGDAGAVTTSSWQITSGLSVSALGVLILA